MSITDQGLLEIAEHEGVVPAPYYDSVGVLTWGIGHTKNAGGVNPADMPMAMPNDLDSALDQVIDVFREDVAKYADRVNRAVKVPLKPYERDALISFDLNTGGIFRAKLTAAINRKDPKASDHFFGWLKPPEIRKRRTAEKRLFDTGDYDHNGDTITVWSTNNAGRLTRPMTTIRGGELLERINARKAPDFEPLNDVIPSREAMEAVLKEMNDLKGAVEKAASSMGMSL